MIRFTNQTLIKQRFLATISSNPTARPFTDIPLAPEDENGTVITHFMTNGGFDEFTSIVSDLHKRLGPIYRFKLMPHKPYSVSVADTGAIAQVYRSEGINIFKKFCLLECERRGHANISELRLFFF